jgi:mRNA-degrading endonuclease YafQ of YafQ-DinJ toxin-antitoxin module
MLEITYSGQFKKDIAKAKKQKKDIELLKSIIQLLVEMSSPRFMHISK